ncbi:acylneuraminate cytidylyltransferase family protein [Thalassospiraceae bacterium LMO-SO8]|nr:acylneuraminate cytidylyltransferase family protein [Alphaproteobacteria bacterium LMO-S08]WND77697.1 acylneuraminate cytidylyltransferase family protein [Thalassospiraceae bacterium LMO-SO8]
MSERNLQHSATNQTPQMIDGKTCLGVIVGRGGSKGLPGKNVADLAGRPLVAWSVSAALESVHLDHTILSSDDDAIIAAANDAGCDVPFRRPSELATDTAPVADAMIHALDHLDGNFDYVVLLPATSPLRTGADIDACIEACHTGADCAVTVCESAKPVEWACRLGPDGRLTPVIPGDGLLTRRQDIAPTYLPNGAVYVVRTDWFRQHRAFYSQNLVACVMPDERSIDIDTELDLMTARLLAERQAAARKRKIP